QHLRDVDLRAASQQQHGRCSYAVQLLAPADVSRTNGGTLMSQENPALTIFKIWAAMAWADGTLDPAEADTLRKLMEAAGVTRADREHAARWLEAPVELDVPSVTGLGESTRRGIYRVAAKLAAIDLEVSAPEKELLEKLRGLLAISPEEARRIAGSA